MGKHPDLALYVGEAGTRLADGTDLIPHETVCEVGRGEAEASDLWEPVTDKPKTKPATAQGGDV